MHTNKTARQKIIELEERNAFMTESGMHSLNLREYFEAMFSRNGKTQLQERHKLNDFKYNGIVTAISPECIRHYIITANPDESLLRKMMNENFAVTSPITYVGRSRKAKNARRLYGLTIDLDDVPTKKIKWMFKMYDNGTAYLRPSIITSSGTGLHLYYLLKKPVSLFKNTISLMSKLKNALTDLCWNEHTSDFPLESRQYQGIFQGFRIPGTKTKFGEKVMTFAWDEIRYYDLEEINDAADIPKEFSSNRNLTKEELAEINGTRPRTPIETAKKEWPEWYERKTKDEEKPAWSYKPDLYFWWLDKIRNPVNPKVGHRYFCIMQLAVLAYKCHIPRSVVTKDAHSLVEQFEALTVSDDNHFTHEDVDEALRYYSEDCMLYNRKTASLLTGIPTTASKRNGLKREVHLIKARMLRNFNQSLNHTAWNDRRGRTKGASKERAKIYLWRQQHPDAKKKTQCARELGISQPTVLRWWNDKPDENTLKKARILEKKQRNARLQQEFEIEQAQKTKNL